MAAVKGFFVVVPF